jgi:hypothetical protein
MTKVCHPTVQPAMMCSRRSSGSSDSMRCSR